MTAGRSAGVESRRQGELAVAHAKAAEEARAAARRYAAAEVSERATVAALDRLSGVGYFLLPDRRWPGSRRANVDLVLVGPGGVFIVDTKWWADVAIREGRIYRGQADVTDEVEGLASLGQETERELAEIGLSPNEVHPMVVLHGRSGIDERVAGVLVVGEGDALRRVAAHGQRHTASRVEEVLARCLEIFPVMPAGGSGRHPSVTAVVPEPVLEETVAWDAPLLTEGAVQSALLESLLTSPVEDWMAFLHPSQAKVVRRSFNGPSRIRGAAGTGKTVVGLHRAAYLARAHPGSRVLVTTFVSTLPAVLAQSLARLAPDVVGQVDFTSVHKFARSVLDARGVVVRVDNSRAESVFGTAWASVGRHGLLKEIGLPPAYWKEELDAVLRGRGITDFAVYADLQRTGRRHRLTVDQRRAVWDLHVAYERGLRACGITDFAGMIVLSEAALRSHPHGSVAGEVPIRAVVVDEAQDLTCAQVRLLHSITGDAPDGLTLIGDGQQSIYPGGYTLAEAGVSLSGRGVVMDLNYRNTAQIIEFADRLVDGDEFADIEGAVSTGDKHESVGRTGPAPVLWQGDAAEGARALVTHVRSVLAEIGTSPSDVGVLSPTLLGVEAARRALEAAGWDTVDLRVYDGRPRDAIKVGTIKRAKGLEFKQVAVWGVPGRLLAADATPPEGDAARERWARDRRELLVAMTRARDGLWVGVLDPAG